MQNGLAISELDWLKDESPDGYWGEYRDYPIADWVWDIKQHNTREGYWEWVVLKREESEVAALNRETVVKKVPPLSFWERFLSRVTRKEK